MPLLSFLRTRYPLFVLLACSVTLCAAQGEPTEEYDVVVYGGTSSGIAAAVQVRRMGGTVVVIEPSRRIGGLTTGGLGQTDIGNKAAIGGISREFYQRVREYYEDPQHWTWQSAEAYRGTGQSKTAATEDAMWTFEPSAALELMKGFVAEAEVPVVDGERLDRTGNDGPGQIGRGVQMDGGRIVAITTESGRTFRGKMFIDATYEGDLMAAAGVSYTVGREANAKYGETLNGVQTSYARHHQLVRGVDPYVEAGNPESGLLPGIDPTGPGEEGGADRRVQAYCFRMCLTDHPENRIEFHRPEGYEPLRYELLLRNYEAGETGLPWINSAMPNRKTDTNNRLGFSTDFIGQNYEYPEASYEEREIIIEQHRVYQQGLMWTLANHPRMPESIRREVSRWGMCRDEFVEGDGWQEQLYIREARRMIGPVVMTQHHCQGRLEVAQPISLAAYTMDSHHVQRYVDAEGQARNEGDVQVGGFSPYGIEYAAITPQPQECSNLLVPVCLSASHIAFGSIRMEPVFMVLGQSAATAAMQAIDEGAAVQNIRYEKLRQQLLDDGQILKWEGPATIYGIDPKKLPGIVVDDAAAERQGFAYSSQVVGPFVADGYSHDGGADPRDQSIRFTAELPEAGRYEVRVSYTANANRATNVPVTIRHAGGESVVLVNQREKPRDAPFQPIGTFRFTAGAASVTIANADADGYVVADAVQWLPQQ